MRQIANKVMVLGGGGLTGYQIVRHIARELQPRLIVIVALRQSWIRESLQNLRKEFPKVTFDAAWGNIFMRTKWRDKTKTEILKNPKLYDQLFSDIFNEPAKAAPQNFLTELIVKLKPDIIVDATNSTRALSYQDLFVNSIEIATELRNQRKKKTVKGTVSIPVELVEKIETLIVSQSMPQLIRHVQLLHDAMVLAGTRLYIKIGTTGAGGMGLNMPYTHSEDKPSPDLMNKTAIAFAHTGLLFRLARTANAPIVKEIKPAAVIGYRKIEKRSVFYGGSTIDLFHAKKVQLGTSLSLHPDVGYARRGQLDMVGVDMGETGFYTLGEFEAITSMYQIEFLTPEEVAHIVVSEIKGMNTGKDVIAAIDASVMDPSYRAGILRAPVIEEMRLLEAKSHKPSVALGQIGPPEFSKLLYEAYLLKVKYRSLENVTSQDAKEISENLEYLILHNPIRHTIVSIGVPILLPDGKTLLRGPKINIPEYRGSVELPSTPDTINLWAKKGWVDLRVENMALWQKRFAAMQDSSQIFRNKGSAAFGRETYLSTDIEIGEAVAWIFNNDPNTYSYRIKAV